MDLVTELLVSAREADLHRAVRAHRLKSMVATCRRRLLGILPVTQSCQPCAGS